MHCLSRKAPNSSISRNTNEMMKTFFMIPLFSLLSLISLKAQEFNIGMGGQVLGSIEGAFVGPQVGFEAGIGNHFSMEVAGHLGFGAVGQTITVRPSIKYYVQKNHRGFFLGPSIKYIGLKGKRG